MKKLSFLLLLLLAFTGCKDIAYKDLDLENGLYADIETNRGNIIVQLHQKEAPLTVANFVSLAEGTNPKIEGDLKGKKYYDGLIFHRVIPNFMVQGGDASGTGAGKEPGYTFYNELSPKLRHDAPGVLSMANRGLNTNGSQFFITHKATPWLDGYTETGEPKDCSKNRVSCHTVFGKVVEGQSVVDSIAQKDIIKTVTIVRIGSEAKNFDAPKVFNEEFAKAPEKEKERIASLAKIEEARYQKFLEAKDEFCKKMDIEKAKKTDSGLEILSLKKGNGKRVLKTSDVTSSFTLYLASGKKIQERTAANPFVFNLSERSMIDGFTEAVLKMREGDKQRLFIPYYLAYGENGNGPFPPKADVIFELEILKVGK